MTADPHPLLRGVVEAIPEGDLLRRASQKKLRVKFGVDPTAPDLHLGHLVVLRKLRQFQELGHTVVYIIGDFTARIGDPSGRKTTRPPLEPDVIEANARTYLDQVFQVLDRDRTEVVRNGEWFGKMGFADVLRLAGSGTVARTLERDDFAERVKTGSPIGVHELLYPLMQGYDSVAVRADVEIGATDQKFNLLVGRDLQERAGQAPQVIVTMPLLVGTDGTQKMSKSYGNHIAFRDDPENFYGKVMSIPDALLFDYWRLLTDRDENEIGEMAKACAAGRENPRDVKAALARELVSFFHGAESAGRAERHFQKVVVSKDAPDDVEEFRVEAGAAADLAGLLAKAMLVPSKSEARRMLRQGAVYVNGQRMDEKTAYLPKDGDLFKVGKRRFVRLRVS
ncbi:MAG: tyrosine--tRNA ligase [Candidatus Lindowbacteria bacterium RIFCSPLOWO2_12_FULL_62_27]|nr:MAG: tyrosine--tRNA ligase [Candidatus Lindowbacteria bacterium RIFCSPLOWO2_02_FULL_62_12]OGH60718.1 MAG: tyrosine--tRNA ligase [Candidatus Lindowbacteria bacterium RIFCSPLOWO2_12_FULL_62_27]